MMGVSDFVIMVFVSVSQLGTSVASEGTTLIQPEETCHVCMTSQ